MEESGTGGKSVERLFPFVVRSRMLLVGRETLARSKRLLQCILISEDISPSSKSEVLRDFKDYPVLQGFQSWDFENFFNVRNAKVVGFKKSSLAKSIYSELKKFRINAPPAKEESGAGGAKKSG